MERGIIAWVPLRNIRQIDGPNYSSLVVCRAFARLAVRGAESGTRKRRRLRCSAFSSVKRAVRGEEGSVVSASPAEPSRDVRVPVLPRADIYGLRADGRHALPRRPSARRLDRRAAGGEGAGRQLRPGADEGRAARVLYYVYRQSARDHGPGAVQLDFLVARRSDPRAGARLSVARMQGDQVYYCVCVICITMIIRILAHTE